MESVVKSSIKSVEEYRHNIKLLKYYLKKEQKINQTLRYKDSKKHQKEAVAQNNKIINKSKTYYMLELVNGLSRKVKEMGLGLGDLFRMADSAYDGQITREQFMKTVAKLKGNLQEHQINEMFYAIDSNMNGMLSSDQYQEFLNAHGGSQSKEAIKYQKQSAEKLAALFKKKGLKFQQFAGKMLDPAPCQDMSNELKKIGLNSNQVIILLKMWDPALEGLIRSEVFLKSMQNVKQKDQKQIQNEKYQAGIQELCVIFRDRKINPIQIFELSDVDGKNGVTSLELQEGFRKLMPEETPYQIKLWIKLINVNGDSQITREQFVSAIRSFYSLANISNFTKQYENMHPQLKKALADEEIPAQKIIDELSNKIEDEGFNKIEVFKRIDINHNGLIDKSQLYEGLKGLGLHAGLIGKVLTVFDRDASGEISLDQWLSILGEEVQMEDVEIGKQKGVAQKGQNIANKKQAKKQPQNANKSKPVQQPKQKQRQIRKQTKQQSQEIAKKSLTKNIPLKDQDKNKNNSKNKQPTIDKEPIKQSKNTKKEISNKQTKNQIIKKQSKVPTKQLSQKQSTKTKQPSKQIQKKQSKKQSKKTEPKKVEPKVPFKEFADEEQLPQIDQTFSENEATPITPELQEQIVNIYAKAAKKTIELFEKGIKNKKKGMNQSEFKLFLAALKLKTTYSDIDVSTLFEQSCDTNGLVTKQWFTNLAERYDIVPEKQPEMVVSKKELVSKVKTPDEDNKMIDMSKKEIIKSKIQEQQKADLTKKESKKQPKLLIEKAKAKEVKEPQNIEQSNNYEQQFQNESQLKKKKIDENAKRGQDIDNFKEVENYQIQNQVHSDEGYKLTNYISSQQDVNLLKSKYLTTANSIKKNKKIFQDKSFPASLTSLTSLSPNQSQIPDVTILKWKHYKQFYKNPELFKNSVEPNDIKQGLLGDCYFLCSLAALAQYKKLIERLFQYYDIDNGYFLIWLCIDGSWKLIQVDGYFPIAPNSSRPAFSHSIQQELWVMLLEKAYAKAYGSYEHINGGQPYEAIKDLSGAPGQSLSHRKEAVKQDDLWQKLFNANKNQFIMTCGTDRDESGTITMDGHSQSITAEGLVLGHAYSILDIKEYKKQRLIQLRNPWGQTEWKGDWSDESPKWTQQAKQELGYRVFQNDGIFWMPFQVYFSKYTTTAINYIRPDYFYASQQRKNVKRLHLKIQSKQIKHGFAMITQSDHRKVGLPPNTPYSLTNIIALEFKGGKVIREISNEKYLYQREGSVQFDNLGKDSEIIILVTLQQKSDVTICTYSDNPLIYDIDDNDETFMKYVEAFATMEERAKNVQTSQNKFKSWVTSVGENAFLVFKNIAKQQIKLNLQLLSPKNIELTSKTGKFDVSLGVGVTQCIKGRILNIKQQFSFGQMKISLA